LKSKKVEATGYIKMYTNTERKPLLLTDEQTELRIEEEKTKRIQAEQKTRQEEEKTKQVEAEEKTKQAEEKTKQLNAFLQTGKLTNDEFLFLMTRSCETPNSEFNKTYIILVHQKKLFYLFSLRGDSAQVIIEILTILASVFSICVVVFLGNNGSIQVLIAASFAALLCCIKLLSRIAEKG